MTYDQSLRQVLHMFNKLNAQFLAVFPGPNKTEMRFYSVHGRLVLVQLWHDGGWTHYVQSPHNSLAGTQAELEAL